LVPDEEHQKRESFEGISWHPVKVRKVNFSPTLKAGQWRYFAGQVASADFMSHHHSPSGLPHHYSNIEVQTRFLMDLLTRQLEANDTDWAHCYHARVYLIEPRRDYRGFMRVWRECFPDSAKSPALAFVPSTGILFEGPLIGIDPSCGAKYRAAPRIVTGKASPAICAVKKPRSGEAARILLLSYDRQLPERWRRTPVRQALQQLGWSDGGNVRIETRVTSAIPSAFAATAPEGPALSHALRTNPRSLCCRFKT